jgi:hypothetical protein
MKCLNASCDKTAVKKYCSVSCQMSHQNTQRNKYRTEAKSGKLKTFSVQCKICLAQFDVLEREKLHPQKNVYYCSRACANKRPMTAEVRSKIRAGLKRELKQIECINCNQLTSNAKFCSRSCKTIYQNNKGYASIAGRASARSRVKRSKNEIYFSELCSRTFGDSINNVPMFNGWDADVVVPSLKVAVLWNGPWHYRKLTQKHSVEQVQNRDAIKLKEIIRAGFIPYVIRDNGRFNKTFVESQFKIFREAFQVDNIQKQKPKVNRPA